MFTPNYSNLAFELCDDLEPREVLDVQYEQLLTILGRLNILNLCIVFLTLLPKTSLQTCRYPTPAIPCKNLCAYLTATLD